MRPKPAQLSVIAVAALAIVAVAAAMLLAGGNPAQATTAATLAPDSGDGIDLRPMQFDPTPEPTATPTPRTHAAPEPCPGETGNDNAQAAPAVDSGHIALFDVWWNTEELELTNSSCPPTVEHGEEDVRSPSSINIDETIIHIPSTAMVDLSAANTPYPKSKYRDLWTADDRENPNGDGDRMVWALPACPDSPATTPLCLSFSAALLNDADWDGVIVYHVDHVHQTDIDKQDPRYVLVYDVTDDGDVLRWDSSDARHSQMLVTPGGYDRPKWFFTSRGTYQFQVHITGVTEQNSTKLGGLDPISTELSVNSDVREYTIHVGAEADLGVSVTAVPSVSTDTSYDPGDNVTITVTATNAGPDEAEKTKVDVSLPEGLVPPVDGMPYPSQATKGAYADGVWTIGSMCNPTVPANTESTPPEPECPQAATLTITAKVKEGTRGTQQKVKATISATETLHIKEISRDSNGNPVKNAQGDYVLVDQSYDVAVPDPVSGNDMDMVTVTVTSIPNVDPTIVIMCSVIEFSKPGTKVCDPVKTTDPNTGDTLTYGLIGEGKEHFAVQSITGGAQIVVAQGASINYATRQSYALTLTVSDGKDQHGNDDSGKPTAVDDSVDVMIQVLDFTVSLSADGTDLSVGDDVTFTITLENPPVPVNELKYYWATRNPEPGSEFEGLGGDGNPGTITAEGVRAQTLVYRIQFYYLVGSNETGTTNSEEITVTWSNSN